MVSRVVALGLAGLASTMLGGVLIHLLDLDRDGFPQYALLLPVLGVVALLPVVAAGVRSKRTGDARPLAVALAFSATWLVASAWMYRLAFLISFPADLLSYSEGIFINDITKIRVGAPFYGEPEQFDSYVYAPGASFVTYQLSRIVGASRSFTVLRGLMSGYALGVSLLGSVCAYRLVRIAAPDRALRMSPVWAAVMAPLLFLIATNKVTNVYSWTLNVDGLAQLLVLLGFLVLIHYAEHRSAWLIPVMILLPGIGFLIKQNQMMWFGIFVGFLAVFDDPRSIRRAATVAVGGGLFIGLVLLLCSSAWGDPFWYWTFEVLQNHKLIPAESWNHFKTGFGSVLMILGGGGLLLLSPRDRRLWGLWLVALGMLLLTTYTSGIGYVMNHMGPATVLGAVFLLATLAVFYGNDRRAAWTAAVPAAVAVAMMVGTYSVRRPQNELAVEGHAYVEQIRQELEGIEPDKVMVDVGAFLHFEADRVWRNGAVSVGEISYAGTSDFAGLKAKIRAKEFDRILVRAFQHELSWYDHVTLEKPTHLQEVMLETYRVASTVPRPKTRIGRLDTHPFETISILVPKTDTASTSTTAR